MIAGANPLPAVPTGNNVRTLLGPHLQTGIFDPRAFGQTTVSPDFGPDRVHEWSLGIQREISHDAALEVRYVGNHGTRLFQTIDGNPYILGLANTYPNLIPAGWRPCPASQAAIPELVGRVNCTGGAVVQERANTGYSDYNGLQIELRSTSLWHQLTLQSFYTFSKTTDNTSEIGATGSAGNTSHLSQSQANFTGQEHGLSGLDFPHKFVLSAVEEIPFFKNRGGVIGQVFGGWRAAAVYTLSSGQPYTAVQFSLSCNAGGDICASSPSGTEPLRSRVQCGVRPARWFASAISGVKQRAGAIGRNFRQGYLRQRQLRNSLRKLGDLSDDVDQSQPVQQRFYRHHTG